MNKYGIVITILAALLVGAIVYICCDKFNKSEKCDCSGCCNCKPEEDVVDYTFDMENMNHYCNGVLGGDVSKLDENKLVGIVHENAIYYFDNEKLYAEFCKENDLWQIYEIDEKLDLIYKKAVELNIQDKDYPDVKDVPEEMKKYWYEVFGTEFGNVPGGHSGAKATWSVVAYDKKEYVSPKKTCVGPTYWSLGGFNKKTTSFKVYNSGLNGLWWCHKTWYGKPRIAYGMIGVPVGNLGCPYVTASHDNKFCSYFTLG